MRLTPTRCHPLCASVCPCRSLPGHSWLELHLVLLDNVAWPSPLPSLLARPRTGSQRLCRRLGHLRSADQLLTPGPHPSYPWAPPLLPLGPTPLTPGPAYSWYSPFRCRSMLETSPVLTWGPSSPQKPRSVCAVLCRVALTKEPRCCCCSAVILAKLITPPSSPTPTPCSWSSMAETLRCQDTRRAILLGPLFSLKSRLVRPWTCCSPMGCDPSPPLPSPSPPRSPT